MGLSQIVELVLARIHAAGRDRMQERLPQMRAAPFDEDDLGSRRLPSRSPSRVASSSPAAPPPTTTIR